MKVKEIGIVVMVLVASLFIGSLVFFGVFGGQLNSEQPEPDIVIKKIIDEGNGDKQYIIMYICKDHIEHTDFAHDEEELDEKIDRLENRSNMCN